MKFFFGILIIVCAFLSLLDLASNCFVDNIEILKSAIKN